MASGCCPTRITLDEWTRQYARLRAGGLSEPSYGGCLQRHVDDGDSRLLKLKFDNSPAALRLWNLLLTEEDRLHEARARGATIVGVMKDLGTVAVAAWSIPNVVAFYPDGAWWTPCVMEHNSRLLAVADSLGLDESFCPVRAMVGAFVTREHFPIPDVLVCSAGAVCDDFSAIAQRLEALGQPIAWWEMPRRRRPDPGEPAIELPGGGVAPAEQVQIVEAELRRVGGIVAEAAGACLTEAELARGIRRANRLRACLRELRDLVFTADPCPMPALEMMIAEMLAIHYCSDYDESLAVLEDLLAEAKRRVETGLGVLEPDAVRIFWVNPVADLRVMNIVEDVGGRICGTDYMVLHAIDAIPEDAPAWQGLARAALADPLVGPASDRAERICRDAARYQAQAVVVSRIPGASHCATEGAVIQEFLRDRLGLPVIEIEVPSITDAVEAGLRTRLQALVEAARRMRA
jgi:benzoyl-CoA reductase/2-hydroxyglutaryl-CoA dehydratase subunit BcrC/BadD/HgdB